MDITDIGLAMIRVMRCAGYRDGVLSVSPNSTCSHIDELHYIHNTEGKLVKSTAKANTEINIQSIPHGIGIGCHRRKKSNEDTFG